MSQKVIIIGAGIGGLATAALLAKDGYDVTVFEAGSQPGGRAGQLKKDGFSFDTGPSWYLMPRVFERTFRLLGSNVDKELELIKLTPAYKVFYERAEPIVITGDEDRDSATFEAIEPGAGESLRRYVSEGNDIYELSLKYFLYTNFTRPFDLLKPAILKRGLRMLHLALRPVNRHVAGYVSDQRLRQILEYPMVFLGSSPFSAPAIYSLMSALDFKEGVYYPKGGLYEIIRSLTRLAEEAGVKVVLDTPVERVNVDGDHAIGVTLTDGRLVEADIVISNADLHHTETNLLPEPARSYPQTYWNKREPGISALLLYLGVRGALPELEHHNLLFVDDWKRNFDDIYVDGKFPDPASIYVSRTSATDDTVAPKGHENLFVLVPLPAGIIPTKSEQADLTERYLTQLQAMTGVQDLKERIVLQHTFGPDDFVTRFHAYKASALGMSHKLSQSALFRTPNKSRKLRNLYYVGASTLPGIGLPMCLISAELVYERITGKPPTEKR